jgi:hypothetical protein
MITQLYKVEDYNPALFRRTMITQLYKVEDYNPALFRRTMITQLYKVEDYNPALFRRTMITQFYVRVNRVLTCGHHLHHCIILFGRKILSSKNS